MEEREGYAPLVPQFPEERQALLEERQGTGLRSLNAGQIRQVVEAVGNPILVAHLPEEN